MGAHCFYVPHTLCIHNSSAQLQKGFLSEGYLAESLALGNEKQMDLAFSSCDLEVGAREMYNIQCSP